MTVKTNTRTKKGLDLLMMEYFFVNYSVLRSIKNVCTQHIHTCTRRDNPVFEHHAVAFIYVNSVSQASVIPQTLVTKANGRSSDLILGSAAFPLIEIRTKNLTLDFQAVACFFAFPMNKDSQHRVMSQILTAFPS